MKRFIEPVADRVGLTSEQSKEAFTAIVNGEMDPVEISALLVGLRTKGETGDEIAGAASALRASALPFERPDYPFADSCGTGGDGAHTINVSTAAALVCAGMGIKMAKHGNRSISSKCGSADVFESLGVKLDASAQVSRRSLDEVGICFFFAPMYHSGLRHAGPVRKRLGMRTMMNVLGPLVNPAAPTHQVMGVYDPALCPSLAKVLGDLGCVSAMVVHGDGLDEIAVHGPTTASVFKDGKVEDITITASDAGLKEYSIDEIRGGAPEENTAILKDILAGKGKDAHNCAVAINAGALAWIFGAAKDLKAGTGLALETLAEGKCVEIVERFKEVTNGA